MVKAESGWIKLYRQIFDDPEYLAEPFCRNMAWVDLLLLANHDTNCFRVRGNKITVERGQVGWSEESLAQRWKWSRGKVRRFLDELQKKKQIVQQKNKILSLISICKYDLYQSSDTTDEHQTDDRRTQTKNVKNVKKDNVYVENDALQKSFDAFCLWVANNAPNVADMKEPFTIDQYLKISKKYKADKIKEMLQAMHNKKDLVKKYTSAYLTFTNWMKRETKATVIPIEPQEKKLAI